MSLTLHRHKLFRKHVTALGVCLVRTSLLNRAFQILNFGYDTSFIPFACASTGNADNAPVRMPLVTHNCLQTSIPFHSRCCDGKHPKATENAFCNKPSRGRAFAETISQWKTILQAGFSTPTLCLCFVIVALFVNNCSMK